LIEKYDRIRHNTEAVENLIAMALGPSTPGRGRKLLSNVYEVEDYLLFVTLDQGKAPVPVTPPVPLITGIIGVDNAAAPHGWILHLAIHPTLRHRGLGRNLIEHVMGQLCWQSVGLTTDQDAVDFYRACGFTAVEFHSPWPGIHRFRCTKGNQPQNVLEYYNNKVLPE
jgi:ribosomal protein S18 acetylase RimI-like enzyme